MAYARLALTLVVFIKTIEELTKLLNLSIEDPIKILKLLSISLLTIFISKGATAIVVAIGPSSFKLFTIVSTISAILIKEAIYYNLIKPKLLSIANNLSKYRVGHIVVVFTVDFHKEKLDYI